MGLPSRTYQRNVSVVCALSTLSMTLQCCLHAASSGPILTELADSNCPPSPLIYPGKRFWQYLLRLALSAVAKGDRFRGMEAWPRAKAHFDHLIKVSSCLRLIVHPITPSSYMLACY